MTSDQIKHSISTKFVSALDDLGARRISISDMNAVVDETAQHYPGDDRQQRFYAAIRQLAGKVDRVARGCPLPGDVED